MKKHFFALLIGVIILGMGANAQSLDSKFGLDSAKTVEKISIYTELVKQKNYQDALPAWRYVFNNAPNYSVSTYGRGIYIIRYMIKKTKSPEYIDTLMMVYDQRIKCFGNDRRFPKGYVLGRKAVDCFKYKSEDIEGLKEAHGYFLKSYELQGDVTEPHVMGHSFQVMLKLLNKGALSKEQLIDYYGKYIVTLDKQIKVSSKNKTTIELVKTNIEKLFFDSGVADCATLTEMLSPKVDEVGDNIDELKKMISLLKRSECQGGELYAVIAEKIYKINPDADAANNLAIMFLRRDDIAKTESYLNEAISLTSNNENKADYLMKLATIKLSQKNYPKVKAYASESLRLNPKCGHAHILIGKAYASASKSYSDDAFEQYTVFWAAVDRFIKAKNAEPAIADEANELIKRFSVYFPGKEDAFFRNIKPGDTVKVGSWINETTTARFKK